MTTIEYQTLIIPINLLYTLEEFTEVLKSREEGWRMGLENLLKVCEQKEQYEYCALIKKEIDRESLE